MCGFKCRCRCTRTSPSSGTIQPSNLQARTAILGGGQDLAPPLKSYYQPVFHGLKLDSCSEFNNLTWWNQLINSTGKSVLVENCHQGGLAPGARQWQTYLKNGSVPSGFSHLLGYLAAGNYLPESPVHNITDTACMAQCAAAPACVGLSFQSPVENPAGPVDKCYLKKSKAFIPYDASNSQCTGESYPSDCPFNFFRTSGDINPVWEHVLDNLGSVVPFLGKASLSRPGAWACECSTGGAHTHHRRRGECTATVISAAHVAVRPLICSTWSSLRPPQNCRPRHARGWQAEDH